MSFSHRPVDITFERVAAVGTPKMPICGIRPVADAVRGLTERDQQRGRWQYGLRDTGLHAMSTRASRRLYRNKLDRLLGMVDVEAFLRLVWAVDCVQSGRELDIREAWDIPPEARTSTYTSPFIIHPWKIETLVNEVFGVPAATQGKRRTRSVDCTKYNALATIINALTSLENAEDGAFLSHGDVRIEMHRIAQRQFEWHRRFLNYPQYYRYAFLYGGNLSREAFQKKNRIEMNEFTLSCFAFQSIWLKNPVVMHDTSLSAVGIDDRVASKVLDILSMRDSAVKKEAIERRRHSGNLSYKRSFLRHHPCIAFGLNDIRVYAPLPDLVTARATSGIFYDVVDSSGSVRNEISGRFEIYCKEIMDAMLPALNAVSPIFYRYRSNQIETPDLRIKIADEVAVIIECKASRMSYEARFSDDPRKSAARGFAELSKGVFQIWRYVSHVRRKIINDSLSTNKVGVVLTLDTWVSMSLPIHEEIINAAHNLAADRDPEINEIDRIPVGFCSIEDFESTLRICNEKTFLQAIGLLSEERYQGWHFYNVHTDIAPNAREQKNYPFVSRIDEVLPWWNVIKSQQPV